MCGNGSWQLSPLFYTKILKKHIFIESVWRNLFAWVSIVATSELEVDSHINYIVIDVERPSCLVFNYLSVFNQYALPEHIMKSEFICIFILIEYKN